MAIVPWAARPRSGDARQLNPTFTSVLETLFGTSICTAMTIPAWVWLAQIGSVEPGELIMTGVLGALPLASSILVIGHMRSRLPAPVVNMLGLVVGIGCLWAVWEPMV